MSNEAPACHVERLETSHELSPCASLSRDDNNRTLTLELAKKRHRYKAMSSFGCPHGLEPWTFRTTI